MNNELAENGWDTRSNKEGHNEERMVVLIEYKDMLGKRKEGREGGGRQEEQYLHLRSWK